MKLMVRLPFPGLSGVVGNQIDFLSGGLQDWSRIDSDHDAQDGYGDQSAQLAGIQVGDRRSMFGPVNRLFDGPDENSHEHGQWIPGPKDDANGPDHDHPGTN